MTHYLTFGRKNIADFNLDKTKTAQKLNVYSGFTPGGSQQGSTLLQNRMLSNGIAIEGSAAFLGRAAGDNIDGTLPESTQDNIGSYTLQAGDSLERVALQVYGDSSLWYLIADANGLSAGKSELAQSNHALHTGQRLTIPAVATGQHHTNDTRKILGSDYMIGNTAATIQALVPTPPPLPKQNNRLFAKIVVAIVAAVATVMTAGIAGMAMGATFTAGGGGLFAMGSAVLAGGGSLGLSATLAAGFAAGFVGSIASQGVAHCLKLQDGINVTGALVTGLLSAATAGVLGGVNQTATAKAVMNTLQPKALDPIKPFFNTLSAAQTMETNATTQGLSLLTQQQKSFDWRQFGISTLTTGILSGEIAENLQKTLKNIAFNTGILNSELNSLAEAGAMSAVTGADFNAGQVLQDNLGHSVASEVIHGRDSEQVEDAEEKGVLQDSKQIESNHSKKSAATTHKTSKMATSDKELCTDWSAEKRAEVKRLIKDDEKYDFSTLFITEIYPYALEESKKSGLSLRLMLGQAAQETQWGTRSIKGTKNLFNIKVGAGLHAWKGDAVRVNATEEQNGTSLSEPSDFRAYPSIKASIKDRTQFLRDNQRYKELFDA
ncbi:hypothetical protein EBU99_14405, partial [bacterium]|nr:hypothetical protein [bacterium]